MRTVANSHRLFSCPVEPISVTVTDAVHLSGLSRSEVYRRLASGDIKAVKNGNRTLVLLTSLRGYLATLPLATFRPPVDKSADSAGGR